MLAKNLPLVRKMVENTFPDLFGCSVGLERDCCQEMAGYFVAIVKAHFAFVKWMLFDTKQIGVSPQQKMANLHGIYHRNLVWQYFIKKKKTFSEIVRKIICF